MNNNKWLIKKCEFQFGDHEIVYYRERELIQLISEECEDWEIENQCHDELKETSYEELFENFREGQEFYFYWNWETCEVEYTKKLNKSYLNK